MNTVFQLPAAIWCPASEKAKIVGNLPRKVAAIKVTTLTFEIPAIKLIPAEGKIGIIRPSNTAKKPFVLINSRYFVK